MLAYNRYRVETEHFAVELETRSPLPVDDPDYIRGLLLMYAGFMYAHAGSDQRIQPVITKEVREFVTGLLERMGVVEDQLGSIDDFIADHLVGNKEN